jgi:maltooligosyltrehalose trehalohydrolase
MKIGANYLEGERCEFTVWTPFANSMSVKILSENHLIEMVKNENNYWHAIVTGIKPGANYFYVIDNKNEKPDPASNYQPEGVHGCSQVVNHSSFKWDDYDWRGIPINEMIIYELHVGTFTKEGTFDEIIKRLDDIKELGITMLEIMPVAQFPGNRNWGYDGVYPFAVQNSYGGPLNLKRLVNECHKRKLGVILDVVYNHLGPEGNYSSSYGPYTTKKYKTPWGDAINFDVEYSDYVRSFFIENALYWFSNFHIDALRLDAVHAIYDMSAKHFLQELKEKVNQYSAERGREFFLIAESDLNDVRIINPVEKGGYGINAQWSDDFHNSLHAYLTKEKERYYVDFGTLDDIKESLRSTFVYSGKYSKYRKKLHGNSALENPFQKFVIYVQNHDQVGNRAFGERLASLLSFEELKLAAGMMLLQPYIPMLFMGEEYGEDTPFLYFINHSNKNLISTVRKGRREGFRSLITEKEMPDPQNEETFLRSKLKWEKRNQEKNKILLSFYKRLIEIRKTLPVFKEFERKNFDVDTLGEIIRIHFRSGIYSLFFLLNFGKENLIQTDVPEGEWIKIIDSSDKEWSGSGSQVLGSIFKGKCEIIMKEHSFVLFGR